MTSGRRFSIVLAVSSLPGCGGGSTSEPAVAPVVVAPTLPLPETPPPVVVTPIKLPVPGSAPSPATPPVYGDALDARNWEIGPFVGGVSKSIGVDVMPTPKEGGGWFIDLPQAGGKIGYVTMQTGSLTGKTQVRMRFRVDAEPGVELRPTCCPELPSIITLYFQRAGDDWFATNKTETYRWWATFASVMPIQPGRDYEIVARFDQDWTAILTSHAYDGTLVNPRFQDAIKNATRVGFTFGGGDGYGHGVYATGPARFILTEFKVE